MPRQFLCISILNKSNIEKWQQRRVTKYVMEKWMLGVTIKDGIINTEKEIRITSGMNAVKRLVTWILTKHVARWTDGLGTIQKETKTWCRFEQRTHASYIYERNIKAYRSHLDAGNIGRKQVAKIQQWIRLVWLMVDNYETETKLLALFQFRNYQSLIRLVLSTGGFLHWCR